MNGSRRSCTAGRWAFGLLLSLFAASALIAEGGFLGSWSMSTELRGNEIPAILTLSEEDGELEGLWISQGREMPLENITIDGDRIRFDREIPGGTVLHFDGRSSEETLEGAWTGPFGEAPCSGRRADPDEVLEIDPDAIPNQHEQPIVDENGRRLLWASENEDGDVEWFDMTESTIDPYRFQYGIGKDEIASIDDPVFVASDDPRLAERSITGETEVLGVVVDGIARAYPVKIMDIHEVVNDRFGDKALAVLW